MLFKGDGEAFEEWLALYARELGAEKILVSYDNDSYSMAVAGLGLEHQLCVAHVRKYGQVPERPGLLLGPLPG